MFCSMLKDLDIDKPTTALAAFNAYEFLYYHRRRVEAMRNAGELNGHAELLRIELALAELDGLWVILYNTHVQNRRQQNKL